MLKKKISRKDWAEIGTYNHARKWLQPFCNYTLIKEPDGRFKREQRISLLAYIMLFVPFVILMFFFCLWDCGLKNFEMLERYLGGNWMIQGSESYNNAEKIWNRK